MTTNNMTPDVNRVELRGRLARDPEIRYTAGGKTVCSFSIAVAVRATHVEYVRCTAWESLAETIGALRKGAAINVEGRLQTRSWDDQATNTKKYITEVVVDSAMPGSDNPFPRPREERTSGVAMAKAVLSPGKKHDLSRPIDNSDIPF